MSRFWEVSYREWFNNRERKTWALSFGGGGPNFHDAVHRVSVELRQLQVFDEVVAVTDADVRSDPAFWDAHGAFVDQHPRGYGCWIWKPYVIGQTLARMADGDVLLYVDAGCEIGQDSESREHMVRLLERCNPILYTTTGLPTKHWCKMDLLEHMGMHREEILNSTQFQSGVLFIRKTPETVALVQDWYTLAGHYHLLDDSPSHVPNAPGFMEHRHDQAIFDLLLKNDVNKASMHTDANVLHDYKPILTSRRRSG